MDLDDAGDKSLMELQEDEEPDRVRKRKRKPNKRSRRQSGVTMTITNIPLERKNNKKRVGDKYLLVGAPSAKINIDHPRMTALDLRIQKAALVIKEISAIRARERKLQ